MNNPQRQRLSLNPEALPPENGGTRPQDWTLKSDPEFSRTVPSDDIDCGTLLNVAGSTGEDTIRRAITKVNPNFFSCPLIAISNGLHGVAGATVLISDVYVEIGRTIGA